MLAQAKGMEYLDWRLLRWDWRLCVLGLALERPKRQAVVSSQAGNWRLVGTTKNQFPKQVFIHLGAGSWLLNWGAWLLTKAVCPGLGFGEANNTICGLFSGWELEAGDSGNEETTGLRAGGCVLAADQEAWLLTGGPVMKMMS